MRLWPFSTARAACAETRDWLLLDTREPAAAARATRHLARCPTCQGEQARLQQLRADLESDPPLDDVTRARMLDRLRPALDDLAAGGARRGGAGRGARIGAGLALAAAAVAAVWTAMERGREQRAWTGVSDPTVTAARGAERVVRALPPPPAPTPDPKPGKLALIRPVRPQRANSGDASPVSRVALGTGTRQRAVLGANASLLLVGAELEVVSASPELLEVRLERGTLVAHYRRGAGERLRIWSPGARTEVVGTTFSIEAKAGGSRVAVAQGRVLVRGPDDRDRPVTAGHVWTSSQSADAALATLPASVRRLFSDHARAGAAGHPRPPGGGAPASDPAPALDPTTAVAPVVDVPAPAVATADPADPPSSEAPPSESPAPPPVPPAEPAVPASPPATAAAIYAQAEQAMSGGDLREAQRRLREVIALPDAGALAAVATYELAQIALRAGDLPEARGRLAALAGSNLGEPAELLACEVDLRAGDQEAATRCYLRFRRRHPDSVQDAEALGALLRLAPPAADCAGGRPLLDEYLARYPRAPLAAEARRRRDRCPDE
jgi:TolA-binding protein